VTGIDLDYDAIAEARRNSRDIPHVSFILADVEAEFPVPFQSVDRVLCHDLLEHVHARDRVLSEIRRVLAPTGKLLLSVPNGETSWKLMLRSYDLPSFSDPDHKIEYSRADLYEVLERNRFKVVATEPSVYDTPWTGLIDLVGAVNLPAYRYLTSLRLKMGAQHPAEQAGFYVVCESVFPPCEIDCF
jgi:SAM-dependent methyltransferase